MTWGRFQAICLHVAVGSHPSCQLTPRNRCQRKLFTGIRTFVLLTFLLGMSALLIKH